MPFLSHAGISLRYDRAGAGPAVLLIHGWTFNRTVRERQVVALRDHHTVITVDLRGHGESSHLRTGYTIGAMAGDLEHLVRALGVPRIAVVGWSLGGVVALELAQRLGERVSALGLVCTTAGGLLDAKNKNAREKEAAEMKAGIEADFRGFVRQFAPRIFKAGTASPFLAWAVSQMQKIALQRINQDGTRHYVSTAGPMPGTAGTMSLVWKDSCTAISCVAIGAGAGATRLTHPINPTTAIARIPRTTGPTLTFGVKFIICLSHGNSANRRPNEQR